MCERLSEIGREGLIESTGDLVKEGCFEGSVEGELFERREAGR